jgi:hypothetical protein
MPAIPSTVGTVNVVFTYRDDIGYLVWVNSAIPINILLYFTRSIVM